MRRRGCTGVGEIVIVHGAESRFLNREVIVSGVSGVDGKAAVDSRNGLQYWRGTVDAYGGAAVALEWIARHVVEEDLTVNISFGDGRSSVGALRTLGSLCANDIFFVAGEKE